MRVSQTVTVPGGESTDVIFAPADYAQLRLRNPEAVVAQRLRRARPARPHARRHRSTAQESDRRTTRFGIRQFGYEYAVPLPFDGGTNAYTQSVELGAQEGAVRADQVPDTRHRTGARRCGASR